MTAEKVLLLVALVVGFFAFNFIPTAIAYARRHPERRLLARLNILSTLSLLLWFALLAWALGGERNDSVIGKFVGGADGRRRLIALVVVLVGGGVLVSTVGLMRQ